MANEQEELVGFFGRLFAEVEQQTEHAHKCGFDLRSKKDGCGHVWRHTPADCKSESEFQQSHYCPECGRGPWKLKFNRFTREKVADKQAEEMKP